MEAGEEIKIERLAGRHIHCLVTLCQHLCRIDIEKDILTFLNDDKFWNANRLDTKVVQARDKSPNASPTC